MKVLNLFIYLYYMYVILFISLYHQAYPETAKNLHLYTITLDVDVYDEDNEKVKIDELPGESQIKIATKRIEDKDKNAQTMNISDPLAIQSVNVMKRLDLINRRSRAPIIYHQVNYLNKLCFE